MTVTTDDLLVLARAMGKEVAWVGDGEVWLYGDDGESFDPSVDAGQFVEVLAWLMKQSDYWLDGQEVNRWNGMGREDGAAHDGTHAGIMQAVTEAAVRVARGME
jgi:hypothetical protein